ncbi:MAG: hypothetical protein ACT4PN_05720 [Nitrospiraceae bacterium]
MKSRFPDLTFFLDAAGRYSHSKETPIVFGAVGMQTKNVHAIRECLLKATGGSLVKWSNSEGNAETAKAIFRLLAERRVIWTAQILWKNTPEWDSYFKEGKRLYEMCVKKAQEAAPYAQPMYTFKLQHLGGASGDLLGLYLRRHALMLPRQNRPAQRITVNAVFDSDIQGDTNQKICQNVFAALKGELPLTVQATRISPHFRVTITTEQEEPLLMLPDHVAGYLYSTKTYGHSEQNLRRDLLNAVKPFFEQIPPELYKINEQAFREAYLLPPTTFDHVLPKKQREALFEALTGKKEAPPVPLT